VTKSNEPHVPAWPGGRGGTAGRLRGDSAWVGRPRPAVRQPSLYEKFTPGARRGGYCHTQARLASFASYCQVRHKSFRYPDSIAARVNPMARSTRSPRAARSRRSRLRECQISSVSMAPRIVLVVRSGTFDRLSLLPEAVTIVGLLPCSAP